jgi:hypothetical protein
MLHIKPHFAAYWSTIMTFPTVVTERRSLLVDGDLIAVRELGQRIGYIKLARIADRLLKMELEHLHHTVAVFDDELRKLLPR